MRLASRLGINALPGGRMRVPSAGRDASAARQAGRRSLRVRGLALFLCLASLAAEAAEAPTLFPPRSTIVLLAGLPGDLESDNTYRDQLQTWLEIVEAGGQAQRIFALCDNPESVSSITKHDSPLSLLA